MVRARTGEPTEVGVYNALDQLVSYDGRTYTYDDAGRLASVTGGGQTTTYTWDVWGQLRRVDLPGGDVIEYAIDGAGRRVGRKKNGAWTARWVYGAGLGPVAELDADGRVAKRFVYGSHANVPDYVVTLTRTTTTTLESVAAVVHDRRGGVRELIAMTDSLSSVHTTYDEFGRVSDPNPVNIGVSVPFGFAGGMYDPETGLVHLGAREYDPQTGRWLTPDPIGFAGGPNLYGYVLADPINYIDPLGHGPELNDFVNDMLYNGPLGFLPGWALQNYNTIGNLLAGYGKALFTWSLTPIINNSLGGQLTQLNASQTARNVTTAAQVVSFVAVTGAITANAAGIGHWRVGIKGNELTLTNPDKAGPPTPDFRLGPGHGKAPGYDKNPWYRRLPHYHRRPGIGNHRPWEKGF